MKEFQISRGVRVQHKKHFYMENRVLNPFIQSKIQSTLAQPEIKFLFVTFTIINICYKTFQKICLYL